MKITINNNNTNVIVQCSSGFYIVVARPSLSSFTLGSTSQYSDIQAKCIEDNLQVDKCGAPDFARLSFELIGPDLSLLGLR